MKLKVSSLKEERSELESGMLSREYDVDEMMMIGRVWEEKRIRHRRDVKRCVMQ